MSRHPSILTLLVLLTACPESNAPMEPMGDGGSPPTVLTTWPSDGDASIELQPMMEITFSEYVSIPKDGIVLLDADGRRVKCDLGSEERTVWVTPKEPLESSSAFTLTIGTSVEDLEGYRLEEALQVTFTTGDFVAPGLLSAWPEDGADDVDPHAAIVLEFDESIADAELRVMNGSTLVSGETTIDGDSVSFTPDTAWPSEAEIGVDFAVTDEEGNEREGSATSFRIRDTVAPFFVSSLPAAGTTRVRVDADIRLTFSEPVAPFGTDKVRVRPVGWQDGDYYEFSEGMSGTWQISGNTATFHPDRGRLQEYQTTYEIIITGDVTDASGNRLGTGTQVAFTTVEFDEAYRYHIYNENVGAGWRMSTYSNDYGCYMTDGHTTGSYWHFDEYNQTGTWMVHNGYGDSYFLQGGGFDSLCNLTQGLYDTNVWTFAHHYNLRGADALPGESFRWYILSNDGIGSSQALRPMWNGSTYEPQLQPAGTSIYYMWYVSNEGPL